MCNEEWTDKPTWSRRAPPSWRRLPDKSESISHGIRPTNHDKSLEVPMTPGIQDAI
jgi:hypothetical protein